MKRKYLAAMLVIQALLFIALALTGGFFVYTVSELKEVENKYSDALGKNSIALKAAAKRYEKCAVDVQKFVYNLNDAAPGIKQLGIFVNGITGKKQRGIPLIECANNINLFCADILEYYSEDHQTVQEALLQSAAALEHSGKVLRQSRLLSNGVICMALVTVALALVFVINSIIFGILIAAGKNFNNRQ